MALQVWLPLNGDTRQQGLSNITVTGSPNAWNNGKIGKCAYWNGAVANVLYNNTTDLNYTDNFSVTFWANPVYTGSTAQYAWTVGRADYGEYGYGFQIISATTAQFRFGNGSYSVSAPSNEWHHFVMTVGNSKVTIYKDGAQVSSNNLPGTLPTYGDGNGLGLGCFHYSGNIYPYYGSLNDFRIYDHALSPMEVKQLSQGLILHYPLNRGGWGQENNIKTSIVQNRGCSNFVYNNSTNEWTMTCPTSSTAWGYGIVLNDRTIAWKVNETWLISMDVYTPHSITWNCDINNKPDLDDISSYTGNDYDLIGQRLVCTNGIRGSKTLQAGWNKLWFSQTANTTYGLTNYSTNWGVVTTNETSTIDIKIKNIKGEVIGSGLTLQPTPWCPNSADALATTMGINSTTEYDTSGYCNNGSKMTDTITYTSDTAKYQVSTHFNGTYDGILIENLQLSDIINSAITYAFWIKPEGESGARSVYFGSYSGNSWSIEKTAGNLVRLYWNGSPDETCSGATITDGVWQHVCITKSGTSDVKVYINGVQKWSSTTAHNNLNFPTTYRLGRDVRSNDGTPYKGLMSDFRIYATALSPTDVKSLYQNCATIDPDGTIRGQIRS